MDECTGLVVSGGRPPNGASRRRTARRLGAMAVLAGMICLQGAVAKEEGRAKITDVAFVRIDVSDMQTANNFYHGELKLPNASCNFGLSSQCFFITSISRWTL